MTAARHSFLTRDLDAGAGAIINQAVIGAFDGIADQPAKRKRQTPMGAAVFQRNRGAVLKPEQHDVLVEERARKQLAADVLREMPPRTSNCAGTCRHGAPLPLLRLPSAARIPGCSEANFPVERFSDTAPFAKFNLPHLIVRALCGSSSR